MINLDELQMRRLVLQEQLEELKLKNKTHTEECFEYFEDVLVFAHKSNPLIFSAFHWSQHTPYFNDGDPCVFGINEFHTWSQFDQLGIYKPRLYDVSSEEVRKSLDSIIDKSQMLEIQKLTLGEVDGWYDGWLIEKHLNYLDNSDEQKVIYNMIIDAFNRASSGFQDRFGEPVIVLVTFENSPKGEITVKFESKYFDHD